MMKNKSIILSIMIFSLFLYLGMIVDAEEERVSYPDNDQMKIELTADQFYKKLITDPNLQKETYREYPKATMNIREKILFKEVDQLNYRYKDGKVEHVYPTNIKDFNPAPSPNRQVYFLLTVKETEKDFHGKYVLFDAETHAFISGGSVYHLKKEYCLKKIKEKKE